MTRGAWPKFTAWNAIVLHKFFASEATYLLNYYYKPYKFDKFNNVGYV